MARMLRRHGIRYRYEQPLAVVDRDKVRIWYPDLWLPDHAVAVDYAGLMDRPDYARGMAYRHRVYHENGISHVVVQPDDMTGFWPLKILDRIASEAEARLAKVHELRADMERMRGSAAVAEQAPYEAIMERRSK